MENKNQTYPNRSITSSELVQKHNQGWKIFLENHFTKNLDQNHERITSHVSSKI